MVSLLGSGSRVTSAIRVRNRRLRSRGLVVSACHSRGRSAARACSESVAGRGGLAAIDDDGQIGLGTGNQSGRAAMVAATSVNLALRTTDEQAVLIDTYGRWLNSLSTPTQIVVSAQPGRPGLPRPHPRHPGPPPAPPPPIPHPFDALTHVTTTAVASGRRHGMIALIAQKRCCGGETTDRS
jgi:hypothetical protein